MNTSRQESTTMANMAQGSVPVDRTLSDAVCEGEVLGIYVHIPFCQYRCSYCDFATFADQDEYMDAYVHALVHEIALRTPPGPPRQAQTLFFGGGTPSRLPIAQLEAILTSLRSAFDLQSTAEVTLEANPGTLNLNHMHALRHAGVTRLSIGVQSLNDRILAQLNRIHDAAQALQALSLAKEAGFTSVNADLIFGLPGQDRDDWKRTVHGVLQASPDHLSIYGLIVEPGTLLQRQVRQGSAHLPSEDDAAEMYEFVSDALGSAGYEQYEISNWARPGHACRHNLVYWQHQPYLGVGLSSHSYFAGRRFANIRGLQGYISRLDKGKLPTATDEPITPERARSDATMLGLRLTRGIHIPTFDARFGGSFLQTHEDALLCMTELALLEIVDDHVRLTPRAYLLANQVWQAFL